MPLDPDVADEIRDLCESLLADGSLRPLDEIASFSAKVRERFGPDALAKLTITSPSGLAEGTLTSALGDDLFADSLLYWLTRKNDAELPALFGDGGEGRDGPTPPWAGLDVEARRAELEAGSRVLEGFAAEGPRDYATLEASMREAAPHLAPTAAGHKYFATLFPELLPGFHTPTALRFHLLRSLVEPTEGAGRYELSGPYAQMARELGLPLAHLWPTLAARDGREHRYFRLSIGVRSARRLRWLMMREGGFVAIGRDEPGDLADLDRGPEARAQQRARLARHYGGSRQRAGRAAALFHAFVGEIAEGDVVVVTEGAKVLGVGRVTGPYARVDDRLFAHRRPVEWLPVGDLLAPSPDGPRSTLREIKGDGALLVAIERALARARQRAPSARRPSPLAPGQGPSPLAHGQGPSPGLAHAAPLPAMVARIAQVLERKGQVILHGPPGTGKTHHAEQAARELAARSWMGASWADLSAESRALLTGSSPEGLGAVELCCFHPAFGYEDFLEGFRPQTTHGALSFERRDGLFKRLCRRAWARPDRGFFLVIDEINRGDVPRIFGELLTVIERGRRGQEITLPLTGERFSVPPNVFLIGTMNTADRSIALLDAALRRRFGFVELLPQPGALSGARPGGVPLSALLEALNARVVRHAGRDGRNLQIGHAYFLRDGRPLGSLAELAQALRDDVVPLLSEYFYGDWAALEDVLGPALVERDRQRVDETLFEPERGPDLVRALRQALPEIEQAEAEAEKLEAEREGDER